MNIWSHDHVGRPRDAQDIQNRNTTAQATSNGCRIRSQMKKNVQRHKNAAVRLGTIHLRVLIIILIQHNIFLLRYHKVLYLILRIVQYFKTNPDEGSTHFEA